MSLLTGSGKSLCYCVVQPVLDILCKCVIPTSLVIVVSPLTTLMKDQVATYQEKGLNCVYARASDEEAKLGIMAGHFQLIYMTPETLISDLEWRDMLMA